jgi:hypothetical protein
LYQTLTYLKREKIDRMKPATIDEYLAPLPAEGGKGDKYI